MELAPQRGLRKGLSGRAQSPTIRCGGANTGLPYTLALSYSFWVPSSFLSVSHVHMYHAGLGGIGVFVLLF